MSASLGFARWHRRKMQTSEFLNFLGHSSGSAVSWNVFRGGWHRTAISGILIWLGVLSRAGGVWFSVFFCLPACFPARSTVLIYSICYRTISKFFRNFEVFVRRLPDGTSSPGRSLLSSANASGRSRLGCHHPVILLHQHSTSGI